MAAVRITCGHCILQLWLLSFFFMAMLRSRCRHCIFVLWFLLLLSFFFFLAWSQRPQTGCLPYYYTWCGLSANLECRPEMCCTRLAWAKFGFQAWGADSKKAVGSSLSHGPFPSLPFSVPSSPSAHPLYLSYLPKYGNNILYNRSHCSNVKPAACSVRYLSSSKGLYDTTAGECSRLQQYVNAEGMD